MTGSRTNLVVYGIAGLLVAGAVVLFVTSPPAVASRKRAVARDAAADVAARQADARDSAAALSVTSLHIDQDRTRSLARVSGVLEPARAVTLSAEVEGAVTKVVAEEHGAIDAGAVLLQLDATLRQAVAQRAEAGLIRARAAHRLARLELERQRRLSSRQVGSDSELDRAVNQERAAYAGLGEAEATLAETRDRLAKSTIRAPFAGTVNWLDLEPGSYVRPGDRVAEVLDLSAIEIDVGVTDRQVVALSPGDSVKVEVDVYPGETFEGRVARVGRAAASDTQRYPVEVRVPNPGERLLPGMVADAIFEIGNDEPSIRIPRRATVREFELDYVYALEADGDGFRARRRRVSARPVPFRPQLVEIVDGLAVGDRIASSSIEQLRDGMAVEIRD